MTEIIRRYPTRDDDVRDELLDRVTGEYVDREIANLDVMCKHGVHVRIDRGRCVWCGEAVAS